jgi:hypothetical protein
MNLSQSFNENQFVLRNDVDTYSIKIFLIISCSNEARDWYRKIGKIELFKKVFYKCSRFNYIHLTIANILSNCFLK